jgi:hypothetical protein
MGSYFQSVVDVEATAEEADALADKLLAWLVERGEVEPGWVRRNETSIDGVVIDTRRTVFYSRTDDLYVHCPHCIEPTTLEDHLGDFISDWYDGGPGLASCPSCRRQVGLNDWHWSPPWAFGYLGFTFWGWDWFSDAFLSDVSALLGHRIVRPYGKL